MKTRLLSKLREESTFYFRVIKQYGAFSVQAVTSNNVWSTLDSYTTLSEAKHSCDGYRRRYILQSLAKLRADKGNKQLY